MTFTERARAPLHPAGHRRDHPIAAGRELCITAAAIAATTAAATIYAASMFVHASGSLLRGSVGQVVETLVFLILIGLLAYGNFVYQFSRLGYLVRRRAHRRTDRAVLERVYDTEAPAVTFLVPSYSEERRVVRQTLLSAALQEYPDRDVVLLIDDSPATTTDSARQALLSARALPAEIAATLEPLARTCERALSAYEHRVRRRTRGRDEPIHERPLLASLERWVADALEGLASEEETTSHTDELFVEQILRRPAREHRERAAELVAAVSVSDAEMLRGYRRLAARFAVRLSSFERKRYRNLSHEPNKAMNLNSYIGLIGWSWREVERADGTHLEPADGGVGGLVVRDAKYVVTLDADSLIEPDYVLRLAHLLELPANARVAVAQTPYSAVPGATSRLERIAGATTDVQYIVHQGFTHYDATFWVGANAVIRKAALDSIAAVEFEDGHPVRRFIHDRTVIEDTESSVDLANRGWGLLNYPERLSYSATPPDFGALLIQRRRWANGGLIVLPKLLHGVVPRPAIAAGRRIEAIVRTHYLISIATANVALLAVLAFPFPDELVSVWLPMTALPYFLLYARDLVQAGYRATDLIRVYALNLLLVPVNLGGVLKSLEQAWTKRKIPFGRTPKVDGRTAAPAVYLCAEVLLVGFFTFAAVTDFAAGRVLNGAFAMVNVGLLVYAVNTFIGWTALVEDIRAQLFRSPLSALGQCGWGRSPAVTSDQVDARGCRK